MRLFKKIRGQLMAIVLLCYLAPAVALGFYMGGAVLGDLQAKTESALVAGMESSMKLAEENLDKLISLAWDATYDGELTDAAAQRETGRISDGEFMRLARNYIERKYSRERLLTFAACFTLDRPDMLLANRGGSAAAAAYQASAHDAVRAMSAELDTRSRFVRLDDRLYLVRNLVSLRMKPYGMLVLGIDAEKLAAPLDALAREWDARLALRLDGAQVADLAGANGEGPEAVAWDAFADGRIEKAGGGRYALAATGSSRDYELRAGLLLGRRRLYGEIDDFRLLLAGLVLLLVPILAVIAWYAHRRITRPIAMLAEASRRIEAGELGVTVPMRGDDELGQLGRAFSAMSLRLQELIDRNYKEEIALRDARIQAMQSRINPHFINNALETINWQARMEGTDTVSSMVEALSVLLNAGMSRGNRRMVSLREELDVARAYFYFVGLRFGDRLRTRLDVAPEALEATVPLLTLQPILENAVEHGIAPAGGGEILLRCERAGDCLRLEVSNTGRTASPEDQRRIDAALRGDSLEGTHLGLSNICTRLQLIYGDRARISVDTDVPGRTRVLLELPREDAPKGGKPA